MTAARMQLHGGDRVRYFLPVGFCAFLCLLCLGIVGASASVPDVQGALTLAVTALFGVAACATLGLLMLWWQLRWLRYTRVPLRGSPQAAWEAVHRVALDAGWRIDREVPGRLLEAQTPGTVFNDGERVSVEFTAAELLVASITDPAIGFSPTGHRRCLAHCEQVLRAVAGPDPGPDTTPFPVSIGETR